MSKAAAIETRLLRNAFGAFATGVAIIAARSAEGVPIGVTVNSFSSLSLDPPLLLWSLNANSPTLGVFDRATHFAVNILAAEQIRLSRRFSTRGTHKFANVPTHAGMEEVPIIEGCAAVLECSRHARHMAGDHVLFIGRVERCYYDPAKRPLVFHRGRYCHAGESIIDAEH